MNDPKLVIGFVGQICSGKGEADKYLGEKYGFVSFSLSDQIREEIKHRGLEITRERLAQTGGELREKFGSEILAKRAWDKIQDQNLEKAIIDGARSLGEMEYLQKFPNFHLIAIEADQKIRFERLKQRVIAGQTEPATWETFLEAERNDSEKFGMNVEKVMEKAEIHIKNEGTQEEFHQKLDEVVTKLTT
ncbi:MAG: AAA family ATPase [Microgenomates group bacterium]|jgi:dephospho-CoA kinase